VRLRQLADHCSTQLLQPLRMLPASLWLLGFGLVPLLVVLLLHI
jgi:hypothetical protein